jgi:hypothetical protein
MKSQILIKTPCAINDSKMERVPGGIFCTDCNLKVHDFTHFSNEELTKWISDHAGQKSCGIFRDDQVNVSFLQKFSFPFRYAAIAVVAFFATKEANAQKQQPHYVVNSDSSKIASVHGDTIVKRFYGHVTNEYGKPIPFTHIRAGYNGVILADTLTGSDGSYEILVPFKKDQTITLLAETSDHTGSASVSSQQEKANIRAYKHRHHFFRRRNVKGRMAW